ncbi:MAG: amino acid adenylation domain-containing protein [Planctomycetaceae bacterium]|jgi:amino acid adenylation domain-containing protein|nr:amino acid adenylation domain-containing protein [Planctomycetaceae bacterium]
MNFFNELFTSVVSRLSDKTALVYGHQSLTFGELATKSRNIVLSDSVGGIVPIIEENPIDAIVKQIGYFCAEIPCTIVNSSYPKERIDYIVNECQSPVPQDTGYVVFTSGSTGKPKGVLLPKKTLESLWNFTAEYIDENDLWLTTFPLHFVAELTIPLKLLLCGITVHLSTDTLRKDTDAIVRYIKENGITAAGLPPAVCSAVLKETEDWLRVLTTGSELVRNLYSTKTHIYVSYGCSETAGPLTVFAVDKSYSSTPIGKVCGNSNIYLLDSNRQQLVAEGEEGEICISGQVASGYLNLPELTAERFIKNPFEKQDGHPILFCTNDIGKFLPDGNLQYIQRKDWMVKINGNLVEPGEIEVAALQVPNIEKAIAKGFENINGHTQLYLCYTATRKVEPDDVRKTLAQFLPDYMMPAFIEQLDSLPINQNGKIDRTKIAPPNLVRSKAEFTPPQTPEQIALCEAFAKVLGIDNIGIDDDFLMLGGDSISAVRVQVAVPQFFLTVADILENRTVRNLCNDIKRNDIKRNSTKKEGVEEINTSTNVLINTNININTNTNDLSHCTPYESAMLAEQFAEPASVAYNINVAFTLTGNVDADRLDKALLSVLTKHRVLRSYYVLEDTGFVRKIAETPQSVLRKELNVPTSRSLTEYFAEQNKPFDISQGPLYRFTLINDVFHLQFHHAVMDGTSMQVFLNELWTCYQEQDFVTSHSSMIPDYMDYAGIERDYTADKQFFAEMFADGLPENEMPCKPLRPAKMPVADSVVKKMIPLEQIVNLAERFSVTSFQLFVSAVSIALSKYCGNTDVVLGLPMSGRVAPETAALIGMFVNTVPLRFKPESSLAVSDYIRNVSQLLKTTSKHQTYPLQNIVEQLDVERNPSRNPVFDVSVNYLHELTLPPVDDLQINYFPLPKQQLPFDWTLEIVRQKTGYSIELAYSKLLYDDDVAENFVEQFLFTLQQFETAQTLKDAAALPERQRQQLLVDFAGERLENNNGKTVIDLFRQQVRNTPNNKAVSFKNQSLTYSELETTTDSLAALLTKINVNKKPVGIIVHRSLNFPVSAIGVLKSGVPYLPLDPSYPSDRLEFMLHDSEAEILIADNDLLELVPNFKGQIIPSEQINEQKTGTVTINEQKPETVTTEFSSDCSPDTAFVLLYTSGTTGTPKGVVLEHRNLINFCSWHIRYYHLQPTDAVAAYASFGFDAHMMDFYPALTCGACIHIIPEEMRLDLMGLNEYYKANNITHVFMTTQLGRQFVELMEPSSIKHLTVGGETLVPIEPPKHYRFHNGYGPTECTILTTAFPVDQCYSRVPIGKPIDNTQLYIVDKNGELTPVGVSGELLIAGRQVGKKYLNRPDLTTEKFIPNPFNNESEYGRIYRTGDIVRYLPDGSIDFVGRRDTQVKIRGFRVELSEIEGRIRQYNEITDAAVVAMDAPAGGKCAVAYIVANKQVSIDALNAFIEEKLPPYMVPTATVQIKNIPLNPNGKVDRRKLPLPQFESSVNNEGTAISVSGAANASPVISSFVQEELKGVLGQLAGLNDNLLKFGLTSLGAVKFTAKIYKRLGVQIAVPEIMQYPTVAGIAELLAKSLLSNSTPKVREIVTSSSLPKNTPVSLTANQLGVYFECVKRPKSTIYNIPIHYILLPNLDTQRLISAVAAVIDNHPGMKTVLLELPDGKMMQRPDTKPANIAYREVADDELELFKNSFVKPFAMKDEPLYRAAIVKTPSSLHLFLDVHHLAFDGLSMAVFLQDLSHAYDKKPLETESLSSFDYAVSDEEYRNSSTYTEDAKYLNALLAGMESVSEITPDINTGKSRDAFYIQPVDGKSVETFCTQHGFTQASLFLAVVAYIVSRWSQSSEASLTSISNGRDDIRLQNTCGMFVRTFPLRLSLGTGNNHLPLLTVFDYIRNAQESLRQAVQHQRFPFAEVAEKYNVASAISFAYQIGVADNKSDTVNPVVSAMEFLPLSDAKHKLSINVTTKEEQTVFLLEYDASLYSDMLIHRLADTLKTVLEHFIAEPELPVRNISLVSPEQQLLLQKFNETESPVEEPILHRQFEKSADQYPDRIALITGGKQYTYSQLNIEANKLAHALIRQGVKTEDKIAFVLHRTERVLIAMLGIIKSGGAYIPLDPEYPQERIDYVLQDSGAKLVLREEDIDRLTTENNNLPLSNPDVEVKPHNLVYVIYTSGSTGKPKGVMIEHKGITNYVTSHPHNRHVFGLVRYAKTVMSITTIAFDMFLKESMTTLCNGLTLVFADDLSANNPVELAELFRKTGADAFNTTPSRMLEYIEYPEFLEAVKNCNVVMAGAEKYPETLLKKLQYNSNHNLRLFNTYGPTEITVSCNAKELTGVADITVGAPLLNVHEYVVDADGNQLPVGVVGELWVGGRGVGRGYINLPEQTATKFIEYNGERVYKTGDLACWTPDGEIAILGRNDNQIKLRGLRIELGEIENALFAIPGIKTGAVVIRKLQGSDHICAYYVTQAGHETVSLTPTFLKEELAKTLTPYMVPTAYRQLDAIPKLPNGKNDLKNLPEPELIRSSQFELPKNPVEKAFCDIFAKILGLEQVGANDSFFDLGGSSLLVTRILIESKEANLIGADGNTVSYGDVFAVQTPRALAQILRKNTETEMKMEIDGETETETKIETEKVLNRNRQPFANGEDFDYTEINQLLAKNNLKALTDISHPKLGNILLTGATGFLGIHVLTELLKTENDNTIYCLLRKGRYNSAQERLKNLLFYYFEDNFAQAGKRIIALEGDITDKNSLLEMTQLSVNSVINCAANVSHFSKSSAIMDVNYGGVKNLIDYCLKIQARLVQISTASVAGISADNFPPKETVMNETMLYFGQNLENQYILSKFLAERAILQAAVQNGLDAKIMRVGNLMARDKDGEFQVNFNTNSFVGRLRAFAAVGAFPYSLCLQETELAPIDLTATAVVKLAATPHNCCVFHPYNNHILYMGDIIAAMNIEGIRIDFVEDDEFAERLSAVMKEPTKSEKLTSLIAYQNIAKGKAVHPVKTDNTYTTQILFRMNWRWSETGGEYLHKFLNALIGLGFFR